MADGLNRAQRNIVRNLVAREADGSYIRDQMRNMAGENGRNDWDYEKNVCLVGELTACGYVETAKRLEKMINNKMY